MVVKIIKTYLTIIESKDLEQANIESRFRTKNIHDLFYATKTINGETITHYISHHPFDNQEAANMQEYFTHFYDMSKTTKEAVYKKLGLSDLPIDDEIS